MRANTERAVREVLAREAAGLRPNFKAVASVHGVSWKALKQAVGKTKRGEMVMGTPGDLKEMEIEHAVEMQRTLRILTELDQLTTDALEGLVRKARATDEGKGSALAYRDLGIPAVIADKRSIVALRRVYVDEHMAILTKMGREKEARAPVADIAAEVLKADPASASVMAAEALRSEDSAPADIACGFFRADEDPELCANCGYSVVVHCGGNAQPKITE